MCEAPALRTDRVRPAVERGLETVRELMASTQEPETLDKLQRVATAISDLHREFTGLVDDMEEVVLAAPGLIAFRGPPAPAAPALARVDARPAAAPRAKVAPQATLNLFDEPAPLEVKVQRKPPAHARPVSRPYNFTGEQSAVIECKAPALAVNAFAGTGKTSTLDGYAQARPGERMLYVAFNKGTAEEGARRFPKNVVCKTSHAIAFAQCGRMYEHKLGHPRARDVMELLEQHMRVPVASSNDKYMFAQEALNRVKEYFSDGSLADDVPKQGTSQYYVMPSTQRVDGAEVLRAARLIWAAMRDTQNRAMLMPHDGYLKLFALRSPNLGPYSRILLDEGQDTNPTVFSMILGQACGKVLVGDRRQNIYTFRGSMDAMGKLPGATQLALTQSFRFGPDIAGVANNILGVYCAEDLLLQGCGTASIEDDPSEAQLYRTNAGLFGGAVHWLTTGHDHIHFVGGVENYGFDLITDTWRLKEGNPGLIQDAFIRKFGSFEQLEQYVATVKDKELMARLRIVNQYDYQIPDVVARVKSAQVPKTRPAAVSMTTVHKAKGLEWGTVTLGDDFPELLCEGRPRTKAFFRGQEEELLAQEEAHLLYVGVTRARCVLHANQQLNEFLAWCRRHTELGRPISMQPIAVA